MWHVTYDTWHVTCDTWWGVNILSKFQLPISYRLGFMMLWIFGGKGWLTDSVNNEAVYRTAPATLGLLNISTILLQYLKLEHMLLLLLSPTCSNPCPLHDSGSTNGLTAASTPLLPGLWVDLGVLLLHGSMNFKCVLLSLQSLLLLHLIIKLY